jgi:hypothetical protein
MSEWVNPKYADLVADYKRRQDATVATGWQDRPDAPYRIKMFTAPAADADE